MPEAVQLMAQTEQAPFDDSRKALVFALNAHQVSTPQPYMSRAMCEVAVRRARSKSARIRKLQALEEAAEAARRAGRALQGGNWPASLLDRAHLAGFILQKFGLLDVVHQTVLMVRLTTAALPCTCSRPCCSGFLPVPQWVVAVDDLCEIVKTQALVIANYGHLPGAPQKVGLSTQPELRRQIIKEWSQRMQSSVIDLARRFHLNSLTVVRHRGWIEEWLDTQENNAWIEVDDLFDRSGITGPFL